MHTPSALWHRHTTKALQGALFFMLGIIILALALHPSHRAPVNLNAQLWCGMLIGALPFVLHKKILTYLLLFLLGAFRFLWAISPSIVPVVDTQERFSGIVTYYQPPRFEHAKKVIQKVSWEKGIIILKTPRPVKPGERILLQGTWQEANPTTYPWDPLPAKSFLERSLDTLQVTTISKVWSSPQTKIYDAISLQLSDLSPNTQSLFMAAILGERHKLTPRVEAILQETGMAHFLAISGLHVGLMAAIVLACVWVLPLPSMCRQLIAMCAIWCLLLFTGPSASTCRALTMLSLVLLAPLLGRRVFSLNTLGVTALGYLLIYPLDLFSISFQLSFGAVFAILSTLPLTQRLPKKVLWCVSPVLVSLSATIGTLPFLLIHFGCWVPGGLLFNILLLPLLSLLYQATIITLLLPFSSLQHAMLIAIDWITGHLICGMEYVALFLNISFVPQSPSAGWWILFLCVPPLIVCIFGPPQRVIPRTITVLIASALFASTIYLVWDPQEITTWKNEKSWLCLYQEKDHAQGILYLTKDQLSTFPVRAFIQWSNSKNATFIILTDTGAKPPRALQRPSNEDRSSGITHMYRRSSSNRFLLVNSSSSLCFDRSFQDLIVLKNKKGTFFFDFLPHKTLVSIIQGSLFTPAEDITHYDLATASHQL